MKEWIPSEGPTTRPPRCQFEHRGKASLKLSIDQSFGFSSQYGNRFKRIEDKRRSFYLKGSCDVLACYRQSGICEKCARGQNEKSH